MLHDLLVKLMMVSKLAHRLGIQIDDADLVSVPSPPPSTPDASTRPPRPVQDRHLRLFCATMPLGQPPLFMRHLPHADHDAAVLGDRRHEVRLQYGAQLVQRQGRQVIDGGLMAQPRHAGLHAFQHLVHVLHSVLSAGHIARDPPRFEQRLQIVWSRDARPAARRLRIASCERWWVSWVFAIPR